MHSLVGRRRAGVGLFLRHGMNLSVLGLFACGALTGCDGSKGSGAEPESDAGPGPDALESVLQLDSTGACRIDAECAADLHCFHGACVFECGADADCEPGDQLFSATPLRDGRTGRRARGCHAGCGAWRQRPAGSSGGRAGRAWSKGGPV